jgi:uncharacterized membrane protein YhaH (DUF805 family)
MGDCRPAAFSFDGCIGREEYWARIFILLLSVWLLRLIAIGLAVLNTGSPRYAITAFYRVIGVLANLTYVLLSMAGIALVVAVLVGFASTVVRRLRDRGKSGWWFIVYCGAAHQLVTDTSLWHEASIVVRLAAGGVLILGLIELGGLPGRSDNQSADRT